VSARTLQRWKKQLDLFPEDVTATLGELMHRLAAPLSALALPRDAEQGDVDGFDGIARRGSYERLLPSEWLLRETLPLEFLRRASQVEHSFFQIARRQAAPTRASLALFDAGPDQLGACRLAQLALLLLLVHQTESRGEVLNWQHLHRIDDPPLHTLDEHSVRAFLNGRTARRSTPEDLQEWQQRFPNHEQWWIGSPRLLGAHVAASAISIRESVVVEPAQLEVRFSAPGRAPRERILDLPPPAEAARLLRNPFETERKPAPNVLAGKLRSNLVLNPSGSRLYYRNEREQLVALAVPNSATAHAGTARTYQSDNSGAIIGVTGSSGTQHWLCARGSTVTLRSNRKEPVLVAECQTPIGEGPAALWPLIWFATRTAAFVAPDGSLWRADFNTKRAQIIARGVRAMLTGASSPLVAVDSLVSDGDESPRPCVVAIDTLNERVLVRGNCAWRSVFFAPALEGWMFGVEEESGELRIQARKSRELYMARPLEDAVLHPLRGLTGIGRDSTGTDLGFVALDETRRRISLFTRREEQRLFTASSAISEVARASQSGAFAFVTVEGELGVVDRDGKHRLQRQLAAS